MNKELLEKIQKIESLRKQLKDTDYKALKYIDGEITAIDYAPIKAQRKLWRMEINKIQTEIQALRGK